VNYERKNKLLLILCIYLLCFHVLIIFSFFKKIFFREGAWNLRDKMVAQGVTLRSWSVVAFGLESEYPVTAIQKFITLLVNTCEECGVFIPNRQPPISYASPLGNVEKTLIDAYMVAGNSFLERPQLVICILPNTGVPLYAEIKRVSDTVLGLATQCVQAKHMFAAKGQYCANVCLKINVKLGGMNSYLSNTQIPFVSERPTIVFGADVRLLMFFSSYYYFRIYLNI